MAFARQQGQRTAPTHRCGYRKDVTGKWNGVKFRVSASISHSHGFTFGPNVRDECSLVCWLTQEWSWARLEADVNASFRKGDIVCLLDVVEGRISPTPHVEGGPQPNTWQKSPADTNYRIAKWLQQPHVALIACGDGKESINHTHLSAAKAGLPANMSHTSDAVVYLLPSSARGNVPPYTVKLPPQRAGAEMAGKYPIPTHACGKVDSITSYASGKMGYNSRDRTNDPAASTVTRQYYVVHFPVQWHTAQWWACNIAVNTVYLKALSADENAVQERKLTEALPRPKVLVLPADQVANMPMGPRA
ncbi:hypothetical protein BD413DRAFT_558644 [Trametes elegans]|nr:hypothetical protein BD413DRAFT_558644 [Trametes elegans]